MRVQEQVILVDTITGLTGVKRFHGHSTIHTQSVSDHSARVAQLAFLIALEYYNGDVAKANSVAVLGAFHDLTEGILKNDANSSVKSKYGIREVLKKLETDIVEDLFQDTIIRDLILERTDEEKYNLMKLADTIDFGLFVWDEIMTGNRHMLPLIDSFKKEISKYPKEMLALSFTHVCIDKIMSF
jgi:5'-deoxynucleotidase YfbR-like HD superfamily hydrolase